MSGFCKVKEFTSAEIYSNKATANHWFVMRAIGMHWNNLKSHQWYYMKIQFDSRQVHPIWKQILRSCGQINCRAFSSTNTHYNQLCCYSITSSNNPCQWLHTLLEVEHIFDLSKDPVAGFSLNLHKPLGPHPESITARSPHAVQRATVIDCFVVHNTRVNTPE